MTCGCNRPPLYSKGMDPYHAWKDDFRREVEDVIAQRRQAPASTEPAPSEGFGGRWADLIVPPAGAYAELREAREALERSAPRLAELERLLAEERARLEAERERRERLKEFDLYGRDCASADGLIAAAEAAAGLPIDVLGADAGSTRDGPRRCGCWTTAGARAPTPRRHRRGAPPPPRLQALRALGERDRALLDLDGAAATLEAALRVALRHRGPRRRRRASSEARGAARQCRGQLPAGAGRAAGRRTRRGGPAELRRARATGCYSS